MSQNQNTVRTTCPYCGVGCGVLVSKGPEGITLAPDPDHPANLGRLCSKGSALAETVDPQGRLLQPLVNGQPADWDTALDLTSRRFSEIIEQHGPDSVAFYVSGQLLTEDYYAANKLMKGWIGSANIDTNSRLCMSSAVAAHKRAFGTDTVPCSYEDLERARLVVLAGSNTAWCHPVLYQRLLAARKSHPDQRVVLIDPRRTASADIADLHLPIRPGTDAWLWNGLLVQLAERGEANPLYLQFVEGSDAALEAARKSSPDIATVARICGLDEARLAEFYDLWCRTERVVSVFSQGMNQSSSGTDKGNAQINCHLYTGRIGRPGMGPFSFTGQPNAMGGREVGGLANQLAAHLEIDNPEHRELVQTFWQSPHMPEQPGLKAVDMFRAIREGRIKALWVMATNPAVSLPDADGVREALSRCEFLVVSDCIHPTDTTRLADVVFAAQTWGEKNGMVTNSERRISRQRAFMEAPGEA
ncbi:MAG: nitrate reductase, partial [Gammaproteobacteria bacterium]